MDSIEAEGDAKRHRVLYLRLILSDSLEKNE